MKQIAFRGANRNANYAPIQSGQGQIDQMRRRDTQNINDLKESQSQKEKINSDRISSLETKFSKEAGNRNELKTLEDKTFATRQAAIQKNQQTERRNAQVEQLNIKEGAKTMEALSNFSAGIAKQVTEFQDAKNESDMEAAYAEALAEGLPAERVFAQEAMEAELRAMGKTEEAIADEMARRGVNANVVTQVRSGNKWRDYGRLKAYAEMAGDGYGPWLEQKLNELGPEAASPQGRAGAIQQLQQQYLKQNGLFGLSADFLGPMFSKMRTSSNGVIDAARKRQVVNSSTEMFEEARSTLYTQKSPNALQELFRAKAVGYGSDGKTINGNSAGVDAVFAELGSTNRYTDEEVLRLLENTETDTGETYAQRYRGRVNDLFYERRQQASKDRSLAEREEKAAGEAKVDEVFDFFRSQPDGIDLKSLDESINELKQQGIPTTRLEALRYDTQQNINKREVTAQLEEEWLAGTLTTEDLNRPGVPNDVRNKYLDRVNKLEAAQASRPMSSAEIKDTFKQELKIQLTKGKVDKVADSTLIPATASAMRDYQSRYAQLLQTMEPDEAHTKAYNEVYKAVTDGTGLYKITSEKDTENGQGSFFTSFRPQLVEKEGATVTELFTKFQEDENFIKNTPIISQASAQDGVSVALREGIPRIPSRLQALANKMDGVTATELYEQQIKAVTGKTVKFPPSAVDTLSDQINDPRLQEILNRPSPQNITTSILSSDASGGYSSPLPRGQSIISMAARNGWDPADIAAIASFETMGTLDPTMTSPGRIGLIQAGKEERAQYGLGTGNWDQEIAGIERYLKDRGATPGMGLEDLYATVNGGNPTVGYTPDGNGTIPRSPETMANLLEHKEQASRILGITKSEYVPTRDPNNMSPTLQHFYTTGGETNGGWSEHTDFKQMDNPNTVEDEWGQYWEPDELDNYIGFTDPEFGNISLSELRKRIPIPGGNFGDPRSYGPHAGWDYGTKAGTKLYLKNGARKISTTRVPGNGWRSVFKLPDGRYFAALHGKGV